MRRFTEILAVLALSLIWVEPSQAEVGKASPNVVFIFADDMGYGDVNVLNPGRCKIATPHMDEMAKQGMVFTDAHTSSAVCTPSRYSLMTGRYNWRSVKQKGVINGFGAPLIPSSRLTVAQLLRDQGYQTAMIGKWHLGMTFPNGKGLKDIDWHGTIKDSPYHRGFDYFFGISASLDMPPYIYIENDKFVGECTEIKEFHPGRLGPAQADFAAIDVMDDLLEKSVEYIDGRGQVKPFFLYIALPSPHSPIVPSKQWQGKSKLGKYGDAMMQVDDFVGQIVDVLDEVGLSEETMVIVSSDNGCSAKQADVTTLETMGHYSSAEYRGYKSDIWEGGHRVPFIVKWPAKIKGGTTCDEAICLTDFMATCASVTGADIPNDAAEDSVSFLPALIGEDITTSRKGIIHHSIAGHFAYREANWKLILSKGSGGWTEGEEKTKGQLYDLAVDPGESSNLYESKPEIVERMLAQLESDVARGRSTKGPIMANDADDIKIWK